MFIYVSSDLPNWIHQRPQISQTHCTGFYNYPITPDGVDVHRQWSYVNYWQNHFASGLLADWLSDHRSELLAVRPVPLILRFVWMR